MRPWGIIACSSIIIGFATSYQDKGSTLGTFPFLLVYVVWTVGGVVPSAYAGELFAMLV